MKHFSVKQKSDQILAMKVFIHAALPRCNGVALLGLIFGGNTDEFCLALVAKRSQSTRILMKAAEKGDP